MSRTDNEYRLGEEIEHARAAFSRALLAAENMRRRGSDRPVLPEDAEAWLPTGAAADLALLTWCVWCLRYCVPPEFVITAVLARFKYMRRPGRGAGVSLGLPMATAAGVEARRAVEDAVTRAFPNGENIRAAMQSPLPSPPDLDHCSAEDFVAKYAAAVAAAQSAPPREMHARPYRRLVAPPGV